MTESATLRCAPAQWRPSTLRLGDFARGGMGGLRELVIGARTAHSVIDAGALERWPALHEFLDRRSLVLPGGEAMKRFATLERVLEHWAESGVERGHVALAIGGGAITDLVGLAAALCLRGIDFINIPTTLLAMVDASVGGKTAVDLAAGKNLAGAFWPASEVWIDAAFTATETEAHFRAGLAEIVKVGLGLDAELFRLCEEAAAALAARDLKPLRTVIRRAVARKVTIVESDPTERGVRRLLNLGHTYGHALEAWHGGRVPHGLCVAQGLRWVLALAERRGSLGAAAAGRARDLLDAVGLTASVLPAPADLLPYVARDKKLEGGRIHVVLPTAIGACEAVLLEPAEFLGLGGND